MSRRLIQDLHAGISRRDWSAVELASNALRDESEKVRRCLAATDFGSLPEDYSTLRMAEDRMEQLSRCYSPPETRALGGAQREAFAKALFWELENHDHCPPEARDAVRRHMTVRLIMQRLGEAIPLENDADDSSKQMKPIPIEAAKRIAKEYGYDQVLIYARRCHDTPEPHGEHMTTYGRNREHCGVAARIGDTLKKFMGWEV